MHAEFFDTNVILYLLDRGAKAKTAEDLIAQRGMISVQVLNETLANCLYKAKMSWNEADQFLDGVRHLCTVTDFSAKTHDIGRALGARYKFSVYDAMIIAAALEANCTTLYSEDMQDGLLVEDQIRIVNPFWL